MTMLTNVKILDHTNLTAATDGILSLSFCVIATRTVETEAAGPVKGKV